MPELSTASLRAVPSGVREMFENGKRRKRLQAMTELWRRWRD